MTPVLAAAFVFAAAGARAQETLPRTPPVAAPAAPSPQLPAAAASAAPAAPQLPPAASAAPGRTTGAPNMQRIYHIRQLEATLTNAVKAGAASLAAALKITEPNSLFVTGNARARGFELDGYGIFFDVDVPTMMQSMLWVTQQQQQQQQYVATLQQRLADPALDPAMRNFINMELLRVQRAINRGNVVPIPNPPPQAAPPGTAVATNVNDVGGAAPAPTVMAPAPQPIDARSPDELYTDTIKGALIDAMLSYSFPLQLGDDEWLTIAARATNQGTPGQLDDSSSIVIRVKGSDLSAFLKGLLTREEVMKKIEIKEG